MPHKLLTNLEQTAVLGDADGVERLIEDIRSYNAALADTLTVLVADFDYGKILSLLHDLTDQDQIEDKYTTGS